MPVPDLLDTALVGLPALELAQLGQSGGGGIGIGVEAQERAAEALCAQVDVLRQVRLGHLEGLLAGFELLVAAQDFGQALIARRVARIAVQEIPEAFRRGAEAAAPNPDENAVTQEPHAAAEVPSADEPASGDPDSEASPGD